ncbi:ABC transporter permease subunit [Thiospirochaeta perfilievii]|uniref:ABC transporter permease subunit n=1 Tax=Thiospirochaeta perfilievii TaxID=252967 RepID=A0A5C1QFC6_9SPIO|nr:ABC transporter permease subunit [Thiospirochaeta perfilievii]QEN04902.1 ABC transporter permease subunit [Thiospirochaeta perfilievii]
MIRLKLALLLFLLVVGISIFGSYLAPYSKTFQENIRIEVVDNKEVYLYSPHAPNLEHPFGTNTWGYDLLTIILYGFKYTLIVAFFGALLRFLFGLLIGLPLSFKDKLKGLDLNVLNSFPLFILAYFFLFRITIDSSLPFNVIFIFQVCVISFLGLPHTIASIKNFSKLILKEGFIEAANSLGASRSRIIFKHIIPNIYEKLLILFISEMIGILNIVGQLGIFNLFIGGTRISKDPVLYYSITNELAGLIGQGRHHLDYSQWLLLFPLLGYLLILFTFHFLQTSIESYFRFRSKQAVYI